MDSNVCLGCRFGSVKLEILVPEKYDINDFAKETRNFSSNTVAITKEKPMHFSLTFGSGNEFRVHCSCILNVNRKECSRFAEASAKECKIQHLVYNKVSTAQQIEVKANR